MKRKNKITTRPPKATTIAPPMPSCSVIIPTLNEAAKLPLCLNALRSGVPAVELEVIVVDGGSTDDTVAIARRMGAKTIVSPAGRARQLNAGAVVARSDYFYFLHADTVPPKDWASYLGELKASSRAACFALRFDGRDESPWLRLFSKLSRWDMAAFRFGDQSLLVSRDHFVSVGGYREDHVLLEGNDIIRRLRAASVGFDVLPGEVTTSARRYLANGVLFTQFVFVVIYGLYRLGISQVVVVKIHQWAFSRRTPGAPGTAS